MRHLGGFLFHRVRPGQALVLWSLRRRFEPPCVPGRLCSGPRSRPGRVPSRVHRTYDRIGSLLGIGQTPGPPAKHKSLVVVPVASLSRLTAAGISTALSIGDEGIAVTGYFPDPEDDGSDVSLRDRWE